MGTVRQVLGARRLQVLLLRARALQQRAQVQQLQVSTRLPVDLQPNSISSSMSHEVQAPPGTRTGASINTSDRFYHACSGWPAFYDTINDNAVLHNPSDGELVCSRCGAHLGHRFTDGPRQTVSQPPSSAHFLIHILDPHAYPGAAPASQGWLLLPNLHSPVPQTSKPACELTAPMALLLPLAACRQVYATASTLPASTSNTTGAE